MSVEVITTHRTFDRLEPAKTWLAENTEQCGEHLACFIMSTSHLAADGKRSWRKYDVTEVRTWLAEMRRTQTRLANAAPNSAEQPPTFNEIVITDAPCKTFAEFDFKKYDEYASFGASSIGEMTTLLEAMFARFTEFLVGKLNALLQSHGFTRAPLSPRTDVVVLTAHRVGKWSVHLIIDPPLDSESVAWRTMDECGNFIGDVVNEFNEPLATLTLDQSVYSNNHALRIYRASKPEEPERILRDVQNQRYSETLMIRSLISCLRVKRTRLPPAVTHLHKQDEYEQFVLLSSAFVGRHELLGDDWRMITYAGSNSSSIARAARITVGKRTNSRRAAAGSDRVRAICESPEFAAYSPRGTLIETSMRQAIISCNTNRCELRGGEHKDTHFPVYLELDMLQRRWRQSCMSGNCNRSNAVWRDIVDVALRDACLDYLVNESSWCTVVPGVNRCLFGNAAIAQNNELLDE